MKFRIQLVIIILLSGLFLTACSQADEGPYRIGVINFLPVMDSVLDGFKAGMIEAGYVEGEDIEFIYEGPADELEYLEGIAKDLIENQDIDMLLSFSTAGTQAAYDAAAGTEIPIVFVPVTDPVVNNFVDSLNEPNGNLTGITNGGSDAKRLEWLRLLDPRVKTLYVPYNPNDGSASQALAAMQEDIVDMEVTLITYQVHNVDDIIESIVQMPEGVDGVFLLPDILTVSRTDLFLDEVFARKIVLSGSTTAATEGGALMAFGVDFYKSGVQAARLARGIIEGTPPSDLPVESAEFFLHINLDTANKIGLEISDDLLDQADKVIR